MSRLEGGCHCGKVRFSIDDKAVLMTGYCHCSICRRLSGAPVNAWVAVMPGDLDLTGDVATYRSSDSGHRAFCPGCGAQLWFASSDGAFITLNAPGFDTPDAEPLRPRLHIYVADKLSWFDITDDLPRLPAGPPQG
ncbi:GFA family protein [Polymorphobacter sp.]|uniref:GFA family protein n=1 Tax=Polymorphobacter sp. TaxID=1909290 RepID=UPI003F7127B9